MSEKTGAVAVNEAMAEAMRRDKDVFLMGEDVRNGGAFTVSKGLAKEFGDRIMNTPLAEAVITGAATGAAVAGLRPILEIMFADCMGIAADHIINSAAKMNYLCDGKTPCPLTIRAAEGYGLNLGCHHSQIAESWFLNTPGLKMVVPSNPNDAKGLLISSVEDNNPVIFLEHKKLYFMKGEAPDGYYKIPIGKADVKREGKDLTIVSWGYEVNDVLTAAAEMEKEGISAEVVDLRTLRPLDTEAICASVKKTGRLMIVHEAPKFGGFGGEVAATAAECAFEHLKAPVVRLGGKECPVPFGVETAIIPKIGEIVEAAKKLKKA